MSVDKISVTTNWLFIILKATSMPMPKTLEIIENLKLKFE